MDRVVGHSTRVIQNKLATEIVALFYIFDTGNLIFKHHFMCRDGSRVHGLKASGQVWYFHKMNTQ